ncbi:MAG: 50S ribosomal protein L21 [Calditrichaeota bacterium]|nr:50S ribosomal protein L21 [Calditrichota bacterium]RQW02097.1 MAG: 50S ribosomal protein L21 [Calditrichota bacterium]
MYAIVDIAGKQFRAEENKILKVPYLHQEVGELVEFDNVLLMGDEKETKIGNPLVKDAKVSAKILEHGRDKKVIVWKKKRRKGYQVKRGHRQNFTRIQIENIV